MAFSLLDGLEGLPGERRQAAVGNWARGTACMQALVGGPPWHSHGLWHHLSALNHYVQAFARLTISDVNKKLITAAGGIDVLAEVLVSESQKPITLKYCIESL